MKLNEIESYFAENHNMAVGEMIKDAIKIKLAGIRKEKIRVRGRSYLTGRKKTIHVRLVDLLRN